MQAANFSIFGTKRAPQQVDITTVSPPKARCGFLITSKEILVIRIKPMFKDLGTGTAAGTERDPADLHQELKYNGLMEYKAIRGKTTARSLLAKKRAIPGP